jgi:hypothetical protein
MEPRRCQMQPAVPPLRGPSKTRVTRREQVLVKTEAVVPRVPLRVLIKPSSLRGGAPLCALGARSTPALASRRLTA